MTDTPANQHESVRREIEVVYCVDGGIYIPSMDDFDRKPLSRETVRYREVLPGEVCITREEFMAAVERLCDRGAFCGECGDPRSAKIWNELTLPEGQHVGKDVK